VTGVLHVLDRDPRPTVGQHAGLLAAFGRAIRDHLELRARSQPPDDDDQQAADVAQAIRAGRIVPWYQPVVDLSTGKIIGLEALARRLLPDGRVESPTVFVPIAERSNLIVDLDVAVARVALEALKEWQRTHPALTMSVNFSGRHLDQDDWVAHLVELCSDAGVSPTTVQIEVTETARPLHSASVGVRMQSARSLGFSLWLDDFGSGWAGFGDLLRLPVDGIKIDRSFAATLGTRADNILVRALTTAAVDLGLKVTFEGIERREQVALARELGCHYGQGFFWSAPVPAVGVDRLLTSTRE
jgi:EAL domain-containing protein (putative c-di-GMP-specific phosphodiesterase class I)